MARRKTGRSTRKAAPRSDLAHWKPGSEGEKAKDIQSKGDFGIPAAGQASRADRDYTSRNTRAADPGASQPMAHEHDGVRDHGAGARSAGPSSASGGDVDPDIVGIGGSPTAQSGPEPEIGADATDGSSNEFASRLPKPPPGVEIEPARGRNQTGVGKVAGSTRTYRDTVARATDQAPESQGADAASNPSARRDDAFAGEVSSGEMSGDDDPIEPNPDREDQSSGNEDR
jgi:hypothetical protein